MNLEDPEWGNLTPRGHGRENLRNILARVAVFDILTRQELGTIERIVHRRRFTTGDMIATPRSGLFVVISGSIHVVRHLPDGGQMTLDVLKAGELVGEIEPLGDAPPETSILAVEQSDVIGFFKSDLDDLIQTHPEMGFKLFYRLAQTMSHQMQQTMGDLRKIRLTIDENGKRIASTIPEEDVGI